MFGTYSYLKAKLEAEQLFDIKEIYRVRGIASLDEMLNEIRNGIKYPCVAVDMGFEGKLDLADKQYDKSYHTMHILTGIPTVNNVDEIDTLILDAYKLGRKILDQMSAECQYPKQPAFGFDAKDIHYSAIGPVGMQCYGVTFDFVSRNDFGG